MLLVARRLLLANCQLLPGARCLLPALLPMACWWGQHPSAGAHVDADAFAGADVFAGAGALAAERMAAITAFMRLRKRASRSAHVSVGGAASPVGASTATLIILGKAERFSVKAERFGVVMVATPIFCHARALRSSRRRAIFAPQFNYTPVAKYGGAWLGA